MNTLRRVSLLALWLPALAPAAPGVSCHIHPPGSTPRNPVGIIGPFDDVRTCEQERRTRFGTVGRCHCSADFTPDWRQFAPDAVPDRRPLF